MAWLRNTWYVAAWSHEVGEGLFHRRILGESVLIFRRSDGSAAAIGDICPHRFAPLHSGRIVGDNVECGYHGLQFDGGGACVHNPHGTGMISKNCRVAGYPLVERHGCLWIWPGDPEQATPDSIPDFSYIVEPTRKTIFGSAMIKAHYELINDNLMDASHTQYVHMDLLGTDAFQRSKHEVLQEGAAVHSNYLIPNGEIPAAYKPYFDDPNQLVDYSVNFRWLPASLVRNSVYVTPAGQPPEAGIQRTGSHFMTPETEASTHYFFSHTRNFRIDDPHIDTQIRKWQQEGLTDQDGVMIESVQEIMGARDFDAMHPVLLSIDVAAVRVRRILKDLTLQEAATAA